MIGHHPHVLEGIEEYNGKYICYSLGNFCFGGNSTPSDTDSMIVQQTFTFNKKGKLTKSSKLNIIPCLSLLPAAITTTALFRLPETQSSVYWTRSRSIVKDYKIIISTGYRYKKLRRNMHCTYLRSFFSVLFYFLLSNQHLINQNHQRHRNDTAYY